MIRSIMVVALALAGCAPQTPTDAAAEQLIQNASAEADVIEAAGANEAASLEVEASTIANQAAQSGGFTSERLQTRADALKREAQIVKNQARARAEAVEDTAKAKADTLRSQ